MGACGTGRATVRARSISTSCYMATWCGIEESSMCREAKSGTAPTCWVLSRNSRRKSGIRKPESVSSTYGGTLRTVPSCEKCNSNSIERGEHLNPQPAGGLYHDAAAAIDRDHLPGEITAVAYQEKRRAGDVSRVAGALGRAHV